MATIQSLKTSIGKAKSVVEAAAAATAELTRQMTPEEQSFVIPSEGVNFDQLVLEMRTQASRDTKVERVGSDIKITTTNPTAATKVLKFLGISAEVNGTINGEAGQTA